MPSDTLAASRPLLGLLALTGTVLFSFPVLAMVFKAEMGVSLTEVNQQGAVLYSMLALAPLMASSSCKRREAYCCHSWVAILAAIGGVMGMIALFGSSITTVAVSQSFVAAHQVILPLTAADVLARMSSAPGRRLDVIACLVAMPLLGAFWPTFAASAPIIGVFCAQACLSLIGLVFNLVMCCSREPLEEGGLAAWLHARRSVRQEVLDQAVEWASWTDSCAFLCASGAAIALSFNVGTIVLSIDPGANVLPVTLWCVGEAAGRAIYGLSLVTSAPNLGRRVLLGSSALVLIVCLWGWVGLTPGVLAAWALLLGVADAGMWSAFALIYNRDRGSPSKAVAVVGGSITVAAIVLGQAALNLVAGALYDSVSDGGVLCQGTVCFQDTLGVCMCVAATGVLAAAASVVTQKVQAS
jgi:hypothetical protein